MNLAQVLLSGETRFPDAVAICYGKHKLTYRQFCRDVEWIAGHLQKAGVGPGQLVGVDVRRSISHWVVLLALMRLGARSVSLTDRRDAEVSALPELAAVVTDTDPALCDLTQIRWILLQANWLKSAPEGWGALPPPQVAAGTIGRICFTSGTTGHPKAIELDAGLLHARLSDTAKRSLLNTRSVLWCGLGADVAYGFTAPIAAWLEGASVILSNGGRGAYSYLASVQVNLVIASPAAIRSLLRDAAASTLPPLCASVIVAGGRLSISLRNAMLDGLCSEVLVAYGSSEAGGVTLGDARGLDAHPGYVGHVFSGVDARVVDEIGRPLPPGEIGKVAVRSSAAALSYFNDQSATDECFRDGWFFSGDVATLSTDLSLTLIGRPAATLNIGGVKVSWDDLDAAAREHQGVDDACAVVLSGDRLAIIIVGRLQKEEALAAEIRAALPTLPRFLLISAPSIPRGSMGKVNRDLLAEVVDATLAAPLSGTFAGAMAAHGPF